jgi:CRP/FNR family transcriptional regulator, cyclic AMP receptor protein
MILSRSFGGRYMTTVLNTKQVFVGSSTEGKPLADAVIGALREAGLSPLPWYDFFKSSRPPLQELELLTLNADAAVLVASADDQAIIRGKKWHQARDNVLFEYGLFAGTIGRPIETSMAN